VLIPASAIPDSSFSTLDFALFIYFPPKAGKFDGYAVEVPLVWDGVSFSVE
jgi:hypothetical protein